MAAYAFFHSPELSDNYLVVEQTDGEPLELMSCMELGSHQGFVVAPFVPTEQHPILVIRPDKVCTRRLCDCKPSVEDHSAEFSSSQSSRDEYHEVFTCFHHALQTGRYDKLVLSRSIDIERTDDIPPVELFNRACREYPMMTVIMTCTRRSGLWLAATPEVLLQGEKNLWRTMALAGTMRDTASVYWNDGKLVRRGWQVKEIQEQRYVASYIAEKLSLWADSFSEEGPNTEFAGHLRHLCSVFRFTMDDEKVGKLLHSLHPTPAVCGVPKERAFPFILENEHYDRSYYSGFMGPLRMDGKTSLYVTLRCMQILKDSYRLYAGGGLLLGSDEEQEWQETEAKLDTMRALFINRKS